ncbi:MULTISPECIES: YcjX family protein [unclassified Avibacterium]|uniref:YcjX family protein n=1 Tax=unclassified Avibacterium TaxID=2685287 RepID=UPI0020272E93|nr:MULTISPECIES: YcjX family protein [unclassified Avibacterium]MCW9698399.1 YcjX family protein [Avibacterium sp. 20-129]URL07363.1 YcjX family protein [Avibacterium sp. 21-595]
MFDYIQKELDNLIDRGFDRTLRLAVTGLSRSGKTAFITSLVNQLLHINTLDNPHLSLFYAAREKRILAVKPIEQRTMHIPRFEYEKNLECLTDTPARWPDSTRGVSETRLAIRYQQRGLWRHLKETGTLYLDIFDYPGEWLLDLPLLELDFQQWSEQQRELMQGKRLELAQKWQENVAKIDLFAKADAAVLVQLAKDYTEYLLACKAQGLHFIQPGRFVLAGELEGAPAMQFFPLVHINKAQWQALKKADNDSYFAVLTDRYDYYCQHIVKGFYRDYFSTFDRQVILADCLTPLNHSQRAFLDMQEGLQALFKSFHYGKRTFLNRLFSPKIDKLMFLATKADHITREQHHNLISLLRQLVQEGGRYVAYEGIKTTYDAIAAIRATQQVKVNQNGKFYAAIQGIRQKDQQKITLYPGDVPSRLPNAQFWQTQGFEFDQFEPQPLEPGSAIPHLRMDAVLQFLLADKLD